MTALWETLMPCSTWLMKSEESEYSWEDLVRDGETDWNGVRNYLARNFMRDWMKVGHRVLFYASNGQPSGIKGVMEVTRQAVFEPGSNTWMQVRLKPLQPFLRQVTLPEMRTLPELKDCLLLQKGQRLSIIPLRPHEYACMMRLGGLEHS